MSIFTSALRKINLVSLLFTKRYLSINRYYLSDNFWAFKKNYIGKSSVNERLYMLLESNNFANINLLQIGAHNGKDNNVVSIRALATLPNTTIVLVEPNPVVFEELVSAYSNTKNVSCVNVAISTVSGVQDFYTVIANDSLPSWANQLSSFDKQQILKSSVEIPSIEDFIVKHQVACEMYKDVVDSHLGGHAHVVLIDVEGFDADIVCSMNLQSSQPVIIYFEHKHLVASKFREAISFLSDYGYSFTHSEFDTLAYK